MNTVLTVVGARPQFIKAAVVSRALRDAGNFREVLVHTGQHYDANMSEVFFEELGCAGPDHALGIGGGSHADQTGRMLIALEQVMIREKPDCVLVYGDTNSTLAGALAAAKLHIPIAHVEAGLRSFNRRMPEEINRVVVDHLANLLFVPTTAAASHLSSEGIATSVCLVGDVMYDAAIAAAAVLRQSGQSMNNPAFAGEYVLATIHRAENTDDPARLAAIVHGLAALAQTLPVILPLHPGTHKVLKECGLIDEARRGLTLTEPVGYLEMLSLEMRASLIVTDSGGVQKEAYFQRVPCVTLRDETEWIELVETGWNRLCSPLDPNIITQTCLGALGTKGQEVSLYGNGQAAGAIAAALCTNFRA